MVLSADFTESPACRAACQWRLHDDAWQGKSLPSPDYHSMWPHDRRIKPLLTCRQSQHITFAFGNAGSRRFTFTAPLTAQSALPVSSFPTGLHRLSVICDARSPCVIQPRHVIKVDKPALSSQHGSLHESEEACNPAGVCIAISSGDAEQRVQVLDIELIAAYASYTWPMLSHLEPRLGSGNPLALIKLMAFLMTGSRAALRILKVTKCYLSGSSSRSALAV